MGSYCQNFQAFGAFGIGLTSLENLSLVEPKPSLVARLMFLGFLTLEISTH